MRRGPCCHTPPSRAPRAAACARRRHQYTRVTDWSGGLYISPGFAGSRSGALIATAWASLVHLGRQGFLDATGRIMKVRLVPIAGSVRSS